MLVGWRGLFVQKMPAGLHGCSCYNRHMSCIMLEMPRVMYISEHSVLRKFVRRSGFLSLLGRTCKNDAPVNESRVVADVFLAAQAVPFELQPAVDAFDVDPGSGNCPLRTAQSIGKNSSIHYAVTALAGSTPDGVLLRILRVFHAACP